MPLSHDFGSLSTPVKHFTPPRPEPGRRWATRNRSEHVLHPGRSRGAEPSAHGIPGEGHRFQSAVTLRTRRSVESTTPSPITHGWPMTPTEEKLLAILKARSFQRGTFRLA